MSDIIVKDYIGNEFICKNYFRIISLVPSITELLFSFGLEQKVVGVTKYCIHPESAMKLPRKVVGGTKNPDVDLIESLNPDLIIINKEENRLRHYSMLKDKGLNVFVTFPKTVDQAIKMIELLIKLFQINNSSVKTNFDNLKEVYKEIGSKVSLIKDSKKVRVFCPIWKDPWITINHDTFISSIIEFCGGINVFKDNSERYPKISINEIIESDPGIILLPDEPYKFEEKDKSELYSITETKIELIEGTFHWYSFRLINSLRKINSIFYEK